MSQYGLGPHEYAPVVEGLRRNPQAWLEFMMRYDQLLLPLCVVLPSDQPCSLVSFCTSRKQMSMGFDGTDLKCFHICHMALCSR
jgi:hypothetical protein